MNFAQLNWAAWAIVVIVAIGIITTVGSNDEPHKRIAQFIINLLFLFVMFIALEVI